MLLSKCIHYFPSAVIEKECTKGEVVNTYLLNDVTKSREIQQQREGWWTFKGREMGEGIKI